MEKGGGVVETFFHLPLPPISGVIALRQLQAWIGPSVSPIEDGTLASEKVSVISCP